ncbi:similar to Saccharomyces cerevisiae YER044C-A MEI4 Meiosis-specific protein involved in double-strand break formation during meiotic recombination [Maudiozyma saulgeensis]|uniref:Similar to Saccharomyces cerevisiae YER044C-A MEI4 Meiosis-specific protein involved in double-strand break formation during meiotic recombination n=1 Tax=Maudiozyma saulgeensis TaxID=1789683 RepID=A0A1X7R2R3_9SACH|nr:similar to Saccharomyces cerevisiae YER044C-A MEI4 Meiosis-specific protein involved in double-strand break formation during meiotic recombination [Kazachstania saulgeensis]
MEKHNNITSSKMPFDNEDWILCMAIIKQRNPLLWYKLSLVNNNIFSVKLENIEDYATKVPKVLKPLFVKRTIFWKNINLGYKFQTLNNDKVNNFSTSDLIELKNIASSLCKVSYTRDITPRYDLSVRMLCLYNYQKYFQKVMTIDDIYLLYRSLRWVITSYFCFNQETTIRASAGMSPPVYWIFGVITRVLFPSATQPPFVLKLRIQERAPFISKIYKIKLQDHPAAFQNYCSFQISIIATIINIKLSTCNKNSIEIKEWQEINKDIHDFLLLIESVCHIMAINIIKTKKHSFGKTHQPAYISIFEKRKESIPSFFIDRIKALSGDIRWSQNAKHALYSMLDTIEMICWSEVRYVPDNMETVSNDSETIQHMGKYIQAALLVIGDLDLCSRFRMINLTKLTEHLLF